MNYSKFFLLFFLILLGSHNLDCMQRSLCFSVSEYKIDSSEDIARYIKETKVQVFFAILICSNFYLNYDASFFSNLLSQFKDGFEQIVLFCDGDGNKRNQYFNNIMYSNLLLVMENLSVCKKFQIPEEGEDRFEFELINSYKPVNSSDTIITYDLELLIKYNKKNIETLLALLSQKLTLRLFSVDNVENNFNFVMQDLKRLGFDKTYSYFRDHVE